MDAIRMHIALSILAAPRCLVFDTAGSNVWYEANPPFYGNQSIALRQDFILTLEDGELVKKHSLACAFISPTQNRECVERHIQSCSLKDEEWCFQNVARPECLEELKAKGVIPMWTEGIVRIAYDRSIFRDYGTSDTKLKVCGADAQILLLLVQGRFAFRLVRHETKPVDIQLKVFIKQVFNSTTESKNLIRLTTEDSFAIVSLLSQNQALQTHNRLDNIVLEQLFSLLTTPFNGLDDITVDILLGCWSLIVILIACYDRFVLQRRLPKTVTGWLCYTVNLGCRAFYVEIIIILTQLDFSMTRAAWYLLPVVANLRRRYNVSIPWLSVSTILAMCCFMQMFNGGELKSNFTFKDHIVFNSWDKVRSHVENKQLLTSFTVLPKFIERYRKMSKTDQKFQFILNNSITVNDSTDLVDKFLQPKSIIVTYPYSCDLIALKAKWNKVFII